MQTNIPPSDAARNTICPVCIITILLEHRTNGIIHRRDIPLDRPSFDCGIHPPFERETDFRKITDELWMLGKKDEMDKRPFRSNARFHNYDY